MGTLRHCSVCAFLNKASPTVHLSADHHNASRRPPISISTTCSPTTASDHQLKTKQPAIVTPHPHPRDTGSNTPLLNLLIWHERLLYPDEAGKFSKRKAGEQEQGDRTTMGQLSDRFKGLLANWRT